MSKPVLILFGTQSGNSEDLASQLAKSATAHGLTPTVLDMDAANVEMMASSERILIICSTWGEGEMPDSAEALWDSINAEGVPKMENTHFSVCALGDTSYEFYCQSGKDWDRRLEELGAKRVFARQDCDVDFDEPYAAWAAGALPAISSVGGSVAEVVEETSEELSEPSAEESSSGELDEIMSDGDRKLVVLFGSQSGNSEDLAFRVKSKASEFGLNAEVFDMEGFDLNSLENTSRLLIICSTWGEGDMPDSAEALWQLAKSDKRPKLSKTYFSVCALGDTSYEFFCQSGKDWDGVIEEMGGKRIHERADCDVDFDPTFQKWVIPALASLAAVDGNGNYHEELVPLFIELVENKGKKTSTVDLDSPVISRDPIELTFKIFRYNPLLVEKGWDTYECKMPGHFSLLDVLKSIKSNFDPTLSFRGSGP
ncbi:MAG: flavodoxin domain-containing protein, partial [Candidatus Thermoplasmatota archaeon]|nr:flavodoxin domain-containing protein [Candidatus Thermoplasmatota archaeon]